jgi:membrane-bound serine protease (ClpP class)
MRSATAYSDGCPMISRSEAKAYRGLIPLLAATLCICTGVAHAQSPLVVELTLRDTVQPISAQYLHRGLAEAAASHAALVIITLDTPGGLLESTRTMVADIENSPVPVAVLVGPTGARAGSAGFFLLEAADIAAMMPATNAGASHPIIEGRTLDPILKEKIENDAAAFLRSITDPRHRNAAAAEDAVRNSKSYSDKECLNLHLIDGIVPNEAALIAALNGRTIQRFDGRSQVLKLANATVADLAPSLRERWLTRLTNPDVAILLLLCGIFLIYAEFNAPGTIVPGSLGALLVLLALFGLNLLPVRHTAVALLCAGLVLMLAEFKVPSHGILAFTGVVALTIGLATLVDAPIAELRVHLGVAIASGIGFGAISLWLGWIALRARRNKILVGPQAMIGRLAVVRTALSPSGQVEVRGELWQAALSSGGSSPAGSSVIVRGIEGLELVVDRVEQPATNPAHALLRVD